MERRETRLQRVSGASARSERDSFSCRLDRTYACSQLIITSCTSFAETSPPLLSACWRGPPRINVAPRAVLKSSIRAGVRGSGTGRGRSVWVKNSFSPCSCPTHYIRHLFSGHHAYSCVLGRGSRDQLGAKEI